MPSWQLHRLHDVVRGSCDDHQSGRYLVYALIVAGIDDEFVHFQDRYQPAGRCDRDRVEFLLPWASVSINVLDQRAAQSDVQQLQATANRENRQVAIQCLAQENGLQVVSVVVPVLPDPPASSSPSRPLSEMTLSTG